MQTPTSKSFCLFFFVLDNINENILGLKPSLAWVQILTLSSSALLLVEPGHSYLCFGGLL